LEHYQDPNNRLVRKERLKLRIGREQTQVNAIEPQREMSQEAQDGTKSPPQKGRDGNNSLKDAAANPEFLAALCGPVTL
jgi:hypothetical protein